MFLNEHSSDADADPANIIIILFEVLKRYTFALCVVLLFPFFLQDPHNCNKGRFSYKSILARLEKLQEELRPSSSSSSSTEDA